VKVDEKTAEEKPASPEPKFRPPYFGALGLFLLAWFVSYPTAYLIGSIILGRNPNKDAVELAVGGSIYFLFPVAFFIIAIFSCVVTLLICLNPEGGKNRLGKINAAVFGAMAGFAIYFVLFSLYRYGIHDHAYYVFRSTLLAINTLFGALIGIRICVKFSRKQDK
jgi:hypothetical protein